MTGSVPRTTEEFEAERERRNAEFAKEMRMAREIPPLDLTRPEDRRQELYDFANKMLLHAPPHRGGPRISPFSGFAYKGARESARRGQEDDAVRRTDRRFFDAARKQAMDEREACIAIAAKFSKRAAAALRALPPLPEWSEK
jgi:hypothetical protein